MSTLSKLEKLMYSIGVVDKASAPVNKIMAKINQLSSQANGAQNQMMRGFMGAAGGAMMLVGSLNPAIAANQALGEVSSLGVADTSLQQLNDTAINFTAKYGGNAAEVISASYDIQSSISGLTGEELSAFTYASALMAKGTKSDASTATNYLGTMFGIYQNSAKEIGKAQWVEQLAGKTATAVRMFKTNGNEMSSAFTSLGAGAQSHGIEMAESMAVLGQLQATMSGSEAGTKYKAFLAGVGNAQKALGITLTDTSGKLLPMANVLENIKAKFGNIDTVAKSDALKTAFGSEEATGLIKLLLPQVDQLKNNISELNKQTGMQTAADMANAQTDAWMRLTGGFNSAATALGQSVLPIIEPVVEMLAMMFNGVLWLSREFPTLTGVVATTVVGIVALIVAFSAVNIVMALAKFGLIGFSATAGIVSGAMSGLRAALVFTRGAILAFHMQAALSGGVFALMSSGILAATSAAWAFATALLANPITWIVVAVVALIAGLAALIYYWDDVVAAFKNIEWGQSLMNMFDGITGMFNSFIDTAKGLLEWMGLIDGTEAELKTKIIATAPNNIVSDVGAPIGLVQQPDMVKQPVNAAQLITQPSAVASLINQPSNIGAQDHAAINIADNVMPINTPFMNAYTQTQTQEALANNTPLMMQPKVMQKQVSTTNHKASEYKVEKSPFAQQLSNSISNNSNSKTDQSKRVYIDNVTMKSDDIANDFERLMELTG